MHFWIWGSGKRIGWKYKFRSDHVDTMHLNKSPGNLMKMEKKRDQRTETWDTPIFRSHGIEAGDRKGDWEDMVRDVGKRHRSTGTFLLAYKYFVNFSILISHFPSALTSFVLFSPLFSHYLQFLSYTSLLNLIRLLFHQPNRNALFKVSKSIFVAKSNG